MANPTVEDFMKAKRLASFIVGVKAVEWEYPWQEEHDVLIIKILVDSDWAGTPETQRSTSGGLAMLGRHPVRAWSATQPVFATSSSEAELYSMTERAFRGQDFRSMLHEIGFAVLAISTDSSVAASASTRCLGLGGIWKLRICGFRLS